MYRVELKVIYSQRLSSKQDARGFTLIELLTAIFISGLIAAIAIPSLLKQTVKAKQAAAKETIARVNHTQVIYRTENTSFATTFDHLLVGTLDGNNFDTYKGYNYVLSSGLDTTSITATPIDPALKAYSGGTNRYVDSNFRESLVSVLCEANQPGTTTAVAPILPTNTVPDCPSGYDNLNK